MIPLPHPQDRLLFFFLTVSLIVVIVICWAIGSQCREKVCQHGQPAFVQNVGCMCVEIAR